MTGPVHPAAPELSRPLPRDRIPPDGMETELVASEAECAALARRLDLPAVRSLSCRFRLQPALGGAVEAEGRLRARVVQVCIVTLDEFEADVAEDFALRFVPEGGESAELDLEGEDEVPYAGGVIDLGEAAAEQLALALDPYPRMPGAEVPEGAQEAGETPFTALARLRRPN